MTARAGTLLSLLLILPGAALAEPLPADSGIVNVKDYGASGNGRDDDTAALLRAIAANGADTGRAFWQDRIVYLPDGVYRISDTLLKRYANGGFASGFILMGQSEANTVIRLADRAPDFGDPSRPRAMLFTASKQLNGTPTSGGKDYPRLGEGNDAYMNIIEDLTVDAGEGNPGAIGIDYLANNIGAVRNVTIRAPKGGGAVGLSMTRKWPGPALIRNLTVNGFSLGIATAQTEYGLTFENIRLDGQRTAAIRNDQNALAMRGLTIRGPAPVIVNQGDEGFIAIDGGSIETTDGRDASLPFENAGMVLLRRLSVGQGHVLSGALSGPTRWKEISPPSWTPPPEDEPVPPATPPGNWVNAAQFGAVPDPARDSTDALRKAFASGAETVYLPHGTYAIGDSIDIPASVRRIVGMYSTLKILPKRNPRFARDRGMLRAATDGPPLFIERLAFDNTNMGQQLAVEVAGGRDVMLKDVVSAGVTLLDRKEQGGRTFLENVCCGRMEIAGPRPVVARQFDTEGGGVRILNRGSPLSVLGLKTEGICTVVDNREGARTDIFGGLLYMVRQGEAVPAFRNRGGYLSASFAEESLRPGSRYSVYLSDETPGAAHDIGTEQFPARGLGRFVPALTATPSGQNQ